MKPFSLILCFSLILLSCYENEAKNTNQEHQTLKTESESKSLEQKMIEVREMPERKFKKIGKVFRKVDGVIVENKSVNIWLTTKDKISLYRLSPDERVYVYNETKDGFLFIAPLSDTSITGYLMKGWIDYE